MYIVPFWGNKFWVMNFLTTYFWQLILLIKGIFLGGMVDSMGL
jgi:hypothetical protein